MHRGRWATREAAATLYTMLCDLKSKSPLLFTNSSTAVQKPNGSRSSNIRKKLFRKREAAININKRGEQTLLFIADIQWWAMQSWKRALHVDKGSYKGGRLDATLTIAIHLTEKNVTRLMFDALCLYTSCAWLCVVGLIDAPLIFHLISISTIRR